MDYFENWWFNAGSGIVPLKNEDTEEHTKRVCKEFYNYTINDKCNFCTMYPVGKKQNGLYCKICIDNTKKL
jgi:hypothetical protein